MFQVICLPYSKMNNIWARLCIETNCIFYCRIPDSIAKDIEKFCSYIYPLHDVYIRKVKVVKRPKFDLGRLMDMHGESGSSAAQAAVVSGDAGQVIDRPDGYEPPIMKAV